MNDEADTLKGLRILVAEDESLIAIDLESMLENLGCVAVGPVASVQQVLRTVQDHEIDGAILDVNLRGESILAALPVLRERGIPIVLSSGYNNPDLLPADFRDLPRITKPYNQAALNEICRKAFPARRR